MIRPLIARMLAREEARLGVSLDYLRHVARESLPAFLKFGAFTPLASHRRRLPADAYHVARLVAVRAEDCGTCLQIEVNLAKAAGVPGETVAAVLGQRPGDLSHELRDLYRFSEGVVRRSGEEDEARRRIRDRYGEEALVELALGIASCRVFPTTKRALGYAVSCSRIEIER